MRSRQIILIGSTLLASWLGMEACHELGHVTGAILTGGVVSKVVLYPLEISRTDLSENPHPLLVVWAGPILGAIFPGLLWIASQLGSVSLRVLTRFFWGFCFVANGCYISLGSFEQVGDCGVMLQQGSQPWQLWLFGLVTIPAGFWLWHGQGVHFGFGAARGSVQAQAVVMSVTAFGFLLVMALLVGH